MNKQTNTPGTMTLTDDMRKSYERQVKTATCTYLMEALRLIPTWHPFSQMITDELNKRAAERTAKRVSDRAERKAQAAPAQVETAEVESDERMTWTKTSSAYYADNNVDLTFRVGKNYDGWRLVTRYTTKELTYVARNYSTLKEAKAAAERYASIYKETAIWKNAAPRRY